jgi:hypothetical protein
MGKEIMSYDDKDDKGKSRTEEVLSEGKERYKQCVDYYSELRTKMLDDLEFLDGQQWDQAVLNDRRKDGRPALVVNRMDQFVQHITNAMRQNRISARVFPVDDVADPDTAEILQGHMRHIEADSDGDLAYGTGAFYAVASGLGYWLLRTRYVSPLSFDTEIVIERVHNPFQIYLDPNHRHPSGKDAKFGFKVTTFSKDEYEKEFPDSDLAKAGQWDLERDNDNSDWVTEEGVRIVEYPSIECKRDTLIKMADGSARLKSELSEDELNPELGMVLIDPATGKTVERETGLETVKWYKLNGTEILEETVWPTVPEYVSLPIIKVIGNELDINGRQVLKGIIRNLKDAQRQYNFMLSAQTEAVDSAKGQIVLEDGQIEGHEREWSEASKRKVLRVTGKSVDGSPAKDPFRLQPNMSIQAMTEARLMAADDLKALTGIYDAALGNQSNETSGRAINSRQAQSDIANYHFTGNLVRSVNHSTRLILGAIPSVIDLPRSIRIFGQDDQQKVVKVNQLFQESPNAEPKEYRIGGDGQVGKYDVVCEAGPSPATMKEERAIRMTELVKVAPGLMNVAPDLILKDLGAAHELVERVKKSLPPELQDEQGKDKAPVPPEVQQQLQQFAQQNQELTQALTEAQQQLETQGVQAQSKERIEAAKLEQQMQLEQAKIDLENRRLAFEVQKHATQLDSTEAIALLKVEVDALKAHAQMDAQAAAEEANRGAQEIAE